MNKQQYYIGVMKNCMTAIRDLRLDSPVRTFFRTIENIKCLEKERLDRTSRATWCQVAELNMS